MIYARIDSARRIIETGSNAFIKNSKTVIEIDTETRNEIERQFITYGTVKLVAGAGGYLLECTDQIAITQPEDFTVDGLTVDQLIDLMKWRGAI